MDDQTQNMNDFAGGFLVKDKSGQFKKVQDDELVDLAPLEKSEQPGQTESSKLKAQSPALSVQSLTPQPPISSSGKAPHIIDHEDEEEIKRHSQALKELLGRPSFDVNVTISSIIEKIIREHNLRFDNEVMLKRFSKVLESRLRDVRDSLETKEVLTRPQKIGGLALPAETVQSILTEVEGEATALHRAGVTAMAKPEVTTPPPVEKELFAPPPPPFVPRPTPQPPVIEKPEEPAPISPEGEKPEQLAAEIKKELEQVAPPAAKPMPGGAPAPATAEALYSQFEAGLPKIAQARQAAPERPQLVDIKQPSRVFGPAEELGEVDLKEFRRQGASPTEAAERILEKVDLLEEDSWQMRMEGIAAWKRSEMNRLYVDIGRESIESGKRVAEVIRQRQQAGQPYVLMEEFLAINHLNSRLMP